LTICVNHDIMTIRNKSKHKDNKN